VAKLELNEAQKIGKRLAKYIVYCCGEGEHYIPLIDRLRKANTRSLLLEAIYILIRYGKLHLKQGLEEVSKQDINNLFQFIRTENKEVVSRFHSSLSTYISTFEVENIHKQERYLLELLS
jgi:hypothetical protein